MSVKEAIFSGEKVVLQQHLLEQELNIYFGQLRRFCLLPQHNLTYPD
jgi:hypothetical protein